LMRHEFEPEKPTIHDDQELLELLRRLDASKGLVEEITHHDHMPITVEDIAEACDLDPDFVAHELRKLHAEHREAKLMGAIKELEEPLYRVERPDTVKPDSLDPIFRLRSVQMLMDRHKEQNLPRRATKHTPESKASQYVGMLIVGLVVLGAVFLMGSAVMKLFGR